MRIKTFVASALFLSIFLLISIFMITFIKNPAFMYLYFIFVFFWVIVISFSLKKAYPEKINLLFLIIVLLFVAFSIAYFGNSIKNYYDKNNEIMSANMILDSQIQNLTSTNDYYTSYIAFLNTQILDTKQASITLQSQIDALIAQQNAIVQTPTPAPTPAPVQPSPQPPRREDDD